MAEWIEDWKEAMERKDVGEAVIFFADSPFFNLQFSIVNSQYSQGGTNRCQKGRSL